MRVHPSLPLIAILMGALLGCSGEPAAPGPSGAPTPLAHEVNQPDPSTGDVEPLEMSPELVELHQEPADGSTDIINVADGDLSDEIPNSIPLSAPGSVATFGSGCFWCTEAIFERMDGVTNAVSGYMGGETKNPTYEQVCTGLTGHAEVVQVTYDPEKVSYEELLKAFWKTHDPTTLNKQGADEGTQYRSAVFFHNESQRKSATYFMKKLDESGAFRSPIVTEITKASEFYEAERKHQDYFELNPGVGYCQFVIAPKVEKFEQAFSKELKK